MTHNRAGKYVHQLTGYDAFIPTDLPPDPPVNMDAEMIRLLSLADRKLGRRRDTELAGNTNRSESGVLERGRDIHPGNPTGLYEHVLRTRESVFSL